jgi:hypothetical protein
MRSPRSEPPIAFGADEKLGSFLCRAVHRVEKPLLDIAFAIGHTDYHRLRTGLLHFTRQGIAFQPAVTLLLLNRLAGALVRHRLFRPLPELSP